MTTHGSPIWDTVAPAGPLFAITYNGTCVPFSLVPNSRQACSWCRADTPLP